MQPTTTSGISSARNIPPKKGLTKVQQTISNLGTTGTDTCPCMDVCQKLGTYKQGACFLGTSDTHKCEVANNILLAKVAGLRS